MESIKDKITEAAETHDSFYLYNESTIIEQARKLRKAFPNVKLLYSIKCNPNDNVLKTVFGEGFGADAASANEVLCAERLGLSKDDIYYSAPGKTQRDIEKTLGKATIIADSLSEIERIESVVAVVAATEKITPEARVKIGIRINPNFSFYEEKGSTGCSSKFGVDEDKAISYLQEHRHNTNVLVTGIHVHMRSQELSAAVLGRYHQKVIEVAERIQQECGIELEYINVGSGLGISYSGTEHPLDLEQVGTRMEELMGELRKRYPKARLLVETGRYVVCQSGLYVTKVFDRKVSYGKTYLIVSNTLNGFIRPSLARLIAHYAKAGPLVGSEPLFTQLDAFSMITFKEHSTQREDEEEVTIVGNLCTATDVVAENVKVPRLECGDLIAFSNAGAYGAALSPMQFSSQERPTELFLTCDGCLK